MHEANTAKISNLSRVEGGRVRTDSTHTGDGRAECRHRRRLYAHNDMGITVSRMQREGSLTWEDR